jgi:triosephosphate isomerase
MRRPLIAGNWKMNTTLTEGVELIMKLRELITDDAVEVLVIPPATSLHHLGHLLADSPISLGAQNLYFEESGAFTGELSGSMLKDVGCKYVLVGHSERRQIFKETDENINKKTLAAIREGLKPIICVGESLEEKEAGKTLEVVLSQVEKALTGVKAAMIREVQVAYEPVWAIGTGKVATPEEAEEVHNAIRELTRELYDSTVLGELRIIYGGSVKPDSIDTLMACPNIDGALVGGASLKASDFARIVNFK